MRQELIDWIEQVEGGYVDDPADHGGETNMGITHKTLQTAYEAEIVDYFEVSKLTKEDAIAIYEEFYYNGAHCSHLPEPLDWIHFDTAVNSGNSRAGKILQKSLNDFLFYDLKIDGGIGPVTINAVSEVLSENHFNSLLNTYLLNRTIFLNNIVGRDRTQIKWLYGWLNRVEALKLVAV